MLQEYYLGLAALATLATGAWLFAGERITITSFTAFVGWALCAVFGGGVEKHVDGTTSTVAAPVPDEIRFLLMALALFSVVALVLHQLGVYPPTTDDPYIDNPTQTQTQTND